jgi:hypothetical protein
VQVNDESGTFNQRWSGKIGRSAKWIFRLTAA